MNIPDSINELNRFAANIRNRPNFMPIQNELLSDVRKQCGFLGLRYIAFQNQDNDMLRHTLLSIAGGNVSIPHDDEEDLCRILARGQLWIGKNVEFMPGLPSQCHFNSSRCYEANSEKSRIATGYALMKDGTWRQHSWLIHFRPRVNKIVETTLKRVAYFGYVMTKSECENFCLDNE